MSDPPLDKIHAPADQLPSEPDDRSRIEKEAAKPPHSVTKKAWTAKIADEKGISYDSGGSDEKTKRYMLLGMGGQRGAL